MLKLILILIVLAIVAILIYASSKPDTFHVERSVNIKVSPDKIFPFINDFHQWALWTPYDKDPAMKKTYSGSATGKGATYAWEGNSDVGQGDISITDTTAPNKVVLDLHMIKPFEARNIVVFTIEATGDTTRVTWGMDGANNMISKVMGLFMSMDNMIGKDFEAGLAKMKTVAENQ
ncbi:MAG: polyketide cyclase/dehydrase [Gallionellaceae bacterium]|nr:MAG: polyketide cyclase/dehydrase [Gallionellaceae bacterium]